MRILVVEDDDSLREGLADLLGSAGHSVDAVARGDEAVERGLRERFDLVVLDLMLPGLSGHDTCRRLRTARPDLGVLMLTALGGRKDKVDGFRAGADDYIVKPFAPEELLARVNALGRRLVPREPVPEILEADGCEIDLGRLTARRDATTRTLTPREAGILRWLFLHRARAVSRGELLQHVWGVRPDLQTRTVDAAIVQLRRKVEREPASPRIVVSVQGAGYAWGNP